MFAVLLLHLLIGAAIVASGDRLGRRAFAVAAVAPIVTLVWISTHIGTLLDGGVVEQTIEWVPAFDLTLALRVDAFSLVMVLLVSGIGVLVCAYAMGYFSHPKPGTARLAGLMTVFAGAMLGVVTSDHLLALFVFWELTSVTSYLLIGNSDKDKSARDAALSAILITGMGGLAMLAGLVLVGQAAGTYRLSELAADVPSGTTVTVGLLLVLVGAFTKSAQVPFSSWLPGAMVAPTPISTYLHAATMVKAGVYLVARLSPLFATTGGWRNIVVLFGAATMVYGGWRALRQHDLKLLLAYGTISQLGFLMMLFGAGLYPLGQAGVILLLAHGAFKAALFMVVGIVDHEVGTRDIRKLHGFGPGWSPVVAVGVVAAASMAGFPPLVGFIGKEKALLGAVEAEVSGNLVGVAAIVLGSVLTVAYSARYVIGLLGRLGEPEHEPVSRTAHAPGWAFTWPSVLLAAFSLAAGVAPIIVDDLVHDATISLYPEAKPKPVVLWAGFNTALVLSIVIIAAGLSMLAAHRRVERVQAAFGAAVRPVPTADAVFWAGVRGLLTSAKRTTAVVQSGSLPVYLMIILGVAALAPIGPAIAAVDDMPDLVERWVHVPIAAVIVAGALGATIVRRRIAAALMLGAAGYGMAALYVVQGAPDLALTQFAIETLATVLFVLVLRFLPRRFVDRRPAIIAPIRLGVSIAVGVSVFVLALASAGARSDVAAPAISEEMIERSAPDAKGNNVVNVILVDFRGFDTLGEITVLVVAALGAVALARAARRPADAAAGATPTTGSGFDRLAVLDASARILFPSILVLSLYFLFAGHNQPGGGFVGGLTAGAAISLRYIAGGVSAVRSTFRLRPWTILGGGLLVAAGTALTPLLLGTSMLQHAQFEEDVPILGVVKTTTALIFDIGVYFVVVGLVLMAYEAFGDDVAPDPVDVAEHVEVGR
jgi:multicomponent Na+:H+ antiporter subunit A